jgi:hypothetical protein
LLRVLFLTSRQRGRREKEHTKAIDHHSRHVSENPAVTAIVSYKPFGQITKKASLSDVGMGHAR